MRLRWRKSVSVPALAALAVIAFGCRATLERAPAPRIATHPEAMVVTPEDHASRIGARILREGGNAADAAIAVHFALAVTYPQAGNLGGGGFMLYRDAGGEIHALDFRETAPRNSDPAAYLDEDGRPLPDVAWRGGLAVGVPGSVAGLAHAHEAWGAHAWAEVVAPAAELAREGWILNERDAALFEMTGSHLLQDSDAASVFAPAGRLPRA
ncbi:MAG: gamma-glutamyltransferase, partial [Planctomycetota bacterium]|nr:gamma-glutamyltransferase [Planctomycetota bacterium]